MSVVTAFVGGGAFGGSGSVVGGVEGAHVETVVVVDFKNRIKLCRHERATAAEAGDGFGYVDDPIVKTAVAGGVKAIEGVLLFDGESDGEIGNIDFVAGRCAAGVKVTYVLGCHNACADASGVRF